MNRREVIEELTYYRDTHRTLAERMDRMIKSLGVNPAAPPEQPAPDFKVKESDGRGGQTQRRSAKVDFSGDPTASSPLTLVTPKQLGMIRALAKEAKVDYEAECVAQLDCKPEDLSKRAASAFIDYLQLIKDEGAEFRKVG